MLPQEAMIERVRELCHQDDRVVAALMYGSFALGQGDRFSDIEFYLFFDDEASEGLREEAWVGQIAPLELYYVNEFGNGTAIFENLVRGEFHFEAASNVGLVDAWGALGSLRLSRRCWSTRAANCPVGWVGWYDVLPTWTPPREPCSFVEA
jgi:lincosamide nucleotidyltransferase